MSLVKDIYLGWKNLIWTNPEAEKIASERIKFCAGFDPINDATNDPVSDAVFHKRCEFFSDKKTCTRCGCYMPAKIRSLNVKCPEKKW